MSSNFKNNIKNNFNDLTSSREGESSAENTKEKNNNKFQLTRKKDDKVNKKIFNVYMDMDLANRLEKVSKKSKYSRNELINMMCTYCLDNLDFKEK